MNFSKKGKRGRKARPRMQRFVVFSKNQGGGA
jgi:hypothetical protein